MSFPELSFLEAGLVLLSGFLAGGINTIVGSGSLITFPTLLGVGYEPVVANVSNTVGLVTGSISGAVGYRAELEGQRSRVVGLAAVSAAGGLTGAVLLLALPDSAFEAVVPFLILLACVLVALQPRIQQWRQHRESRLGLPVTVYLTGIYGGYFGAAQGVILLALLGIFLTDHLQRLNALKNVIAAIINGVAAVVFMVVADVAWEAAALIAVGAIAGGQAGARLGRRLSAPVLRVAVLVVGVGVSVVLLVD